MNIFRNIFLWASLNPWMRRNVPTWKYVQKAVKKFLPGERVEDALEASKKFQADGIPTLLTHLGENIKDLSEGAAVCDHYLELIDKIAARSLDSEVSLKLTQLGFDLSFDITYERFKTITQKVQEKLGNIIWIDMEGSAYTQQTIDFYKKIKQEYNNVGLCLQTYLYRTEKDLDDLLKINAHIRLVKGAYKEPKEIAFPIRKDVDKNFLNLSKKLLRVTNSKNIRAAFATHDENLCSLIIRESKHYSVPKEKVEFQMLYGIKPGYQKKLAYDGYLVKTLISYGNFWYPWYMRRLAERPANVWFVLKNIF